MRRIITDERMRHADMQIQAELEGYGPVKLRLPMLGSAELHPEGWRQQVSQDGYGQWSNRDRGVTFWFSHNYLMGECRLCAG